MVKLHFEDIVVEPLVSEKATLLASQGKYCFKVHVSAKKPMITEVLEKNFSVKIKDINIINQKGKKRTTRGKKIAVSYTPKVKKAIITLASGEFPFFETLK